MQQPYGGAPTMPQPVPVAAPVAPPRGGNGLSRGLSIVAVILSAIALVISFAIPGPEGTPGMDGIDGAAGATGPQGPQGLQGNTGATGQQGLPGTNGTNCWDLNENGVGDVATEDLNGDTVVDVRDCTGPQGPQGPQGAQGPTGPQGPQGPVGPAGPGALFETDTSGATTTLGSGCTHYSGAEVTITVPADGRVIVMSQVRIHIDHTSGTEDVWHIAVGTSATDCGTAFTQWVGSVTSNAPTDPSIELTGAPMGHFLVTAGTYTYYINGYMSGGQNVNDVFWFSIMIAIFYPS